MVGISTGLLLLFSRLIDVSRLHLRGSLNDQVSYISAARSLVDTGAISSSLIYPSLLYQNFTKNYLYMPGAYVSLALAYKLFGFGVLQSLLPSLAGYVLTAVCVFLLGERLYGSSTGLVAALIVMCFPANLVYAFSAMAELTVLAAATLAICMAVWLPPRLRLWLGPLLLVLPFLFRETGALTVIPIAGMILREEPRKKIWQAMAFGLVSVALLVVVFRSDLARGRPSLIAAYVIDESFGALYTDAVKNQAATNTDIRNLPTAIVNRLDSNLQTLLKGVAMGSRARVLIFAILGAMALSLVYGCYRRDTFALGAFGMAAVTLGLLLMLYNVSAYDGLRMLMFTVPLLAVVLAAVCVREIAPGLKARWPRARTLSYAALAVMLLAGFQIAWGLYLHINRGDTQADRNQQFIESLGINDAQVLVADPDLALSYVFAHYPVQWSFVPYNRETLALLAGRYKIGTVILARDNPGVELTAADLAAFGLTRQQVVQYDHSEYLVFRPAGP